MHECHLWGRWDCADQVGRGWVIIRGRERYTGEVGRAEICVVCSLHHLLRLDVGINPPVISLYDAMPGEWHFYHAYRFNCIRD